MKKQRLERCLGCESFKPKEPGCKATDMNLVYEVFKENLKDDMEALCDKIASKYEEIVYGPRLAMGESPDIWTPAEIEHHLSYHEVDRELERYRDIHRCKFVENALFAKIREAVEEGEEVDWTDLKTLLSVQKHKHEVYKC